MNKKYIFLNFIKNLGNKQTWLIRSIISLWRIHMILIKQFKIKEMDLIMLNT